MLGRVMEMFCLLRHTFFLVFLLGVSLALVSNLPCHGFLQYLEAFPQFFLDFFWQLLDLVF
jgi:hypothetical protein